MICGQYQAENCLLSVHGYMSTENEGRWLEIPVPKKKKKEISVPIRHCPNIQVCDVWAHLTEKDIDKYRCDQSQVEVAQGTLTMYRTTYQTEIKKKKKTPPQIVQEVRM